MHSLLPGISDFQDWHCRPARAIPDTDVCLQPAATQSRIVDLWLAGKARDRGGWVAARWVCLIAFLWAGICILPSGPHSRSQARSGAMGTEKAQLQHPPEEASLPLRSCVASSQAWIYPGPDDPFVSVTGFLHPKALTVTFFL